MLHKRTRYKIVAVHLIVFKFQFVQLINIVPLFQIERFTHTKIVLNFDTYDCFNFQVLPKNLSSYSCLCYIEWRCQEFKKSCTPQSCYTKVGRTGLGTHKPIVSLSFASGRNGQSFNSICSFKTSFDKREDNYIRKHCRQML